MTTLLAGLVLFFSAHFFTLFREQSEQLIARLGALPYRGLYSLVSLAGFALIVRGFTTRHLSTCDNRRPGFVM